MILRVKHFEDLICYFGGEIMSNKSSLLNLPAKKFFAAQFVSCGQLDKESSARYEDQWIYKYIKRSPISFSQVWVQGIVVLVSADSDDVLIDDGTGVVHVTEVTRLVKNVLITKGMYVMVAGQLKSAGDSLQTSSSSYPTIRTLKFADLSENLCSEALWMLEVIDAQKNEGNSY